MASRQSEAVSDLYRSWQGTMAENPNWTPAQQQDLIEGWNVLTTEPGRVDYVETDAGGVPAMWAAPKGASEEHVLLCLHGGGFISGSMYTHRKLFAHIAKRIGARALIVDYTLLSGGGAHPVPLEEAASAYRWLLDQGADARHVAVTGDSAGGGLAITLQVRAREQGLPLPAAAMLLSPWVDFEVTGGTMGSNSGRDALFTEAWVGQMAGAFLAGASPRDRHANPLYADLGGLGPIYIQVGDRELLLDDSRRLAERARRAGVEVKLDVFPDMQHTFQMMAGRAPEADDALQRLATWARPKLGLSTEALATAG
jgi:monoterpene epsilon-lactone hydrolase